MPVVEQSNPHPPTTAASAPARLLRGFPAGPRTVTLSFGCHCHPASASQVRSALVWPGWGGWGRVGGQAYAGGTREELTLQRGSWKTRHKKPRRQKTGDETEGGRARRGDIWCSRPFQTPFQTLRTVGGVTKHRPQQPSAQSPLNYKTHLFILMLFFC